MITVHHKTWATMQPVFMKMYRTGGWESLDGMFNGTHTWIGDYESNTRSIVLFFKDPEDELYFKLKYGGDILCVN